MTDAQGHFTGGRCRKGEYSREYLLFIADVLCSELGASLGKDYQVTAFVKTAFKILKKKDLFRKHFFQMVKKEIP